MELKDTKLENRYLVLKKDDCYKYLEEHDLAVLAEFERVIAVGRYLHGKKGWNDYVVVNLDEPWAHKVVEIVEEEYGLRPS